MVKSVDFLSRIWAQMLYQYKTIPTDLIHKHSNSFYPYFITFILILLSDIYNEGFKINFKLNGLS